MGELGEYLTRTGAMRRECGVHDCCAFPANWAIERGHSDPMARWRWGYASDAEAEAMIDAAGGLVPLFAEGMREAGIFTADVPLPGDIAVVSLLGEESGAIYTGRRWAFVADRGLAFASLDPESVLMIWRP